MPVKEENEEYHFSPEIENTICNRRAVAVVDASVNECHMATHWIITTLDDVENVTG